MKITIEFTGITKSITQASDIEFNVPQSFTYRDLVKMLAVKYPAMLGLIIDPEGENFLSSNMFVINGNLEFPAMMLDQSPSDGEHISLMSVITGG
ncbi:MAG: MoaD/ThiS family protein, partial [Anaerolineaceae bacterium]|nr:MoaD/ThiS family protein [Anaerolineaceae bacterium]